MGRKINPSLSIKRTNHKQRPHAFIFSTSMKIRYVVFKSSFSRFCGYLPNFALNYISYHLQETCGCETSQGVASWHILADVFTKSRGKGRWFLPMFVPGCVVRGQQPCSSVLISSEGMSEYTAGPKRFFKAPASDTLACVPCCASSGYLWWQLIRKDSAFEDWFSWPFSQALHMWSLGDIMSRLHRVVSSQCLLICKLSTQWLIEWLAVVTSDSNSMSGM